MNSLSRALWVAATLVATCTWGGMAHAVTGPEMAQLLNARYNSQADVCVIEFPAYFCSGVLLRGQPANHAAEFWQHEAVAQALGAESMAYVRKDLGPQQMSDPSGFVLANVLNAIGEGKPYTVLCAYPIAWPVPAERAPSGCGAPALRDDEPDLSSCSAAGVHDAQHWLAHYAGEDRDPARQCSFSTRTPQAFNAALQAHVEAAEAPERLTQIQVGNWAADEPARLAVQALYYDAARPGALLAAQRDQRDYHAATGDWLPVLRLDLTDAQHLPFGFDLREQLYVGYTVAADLNARYNDESSACRATHPAFQCNGVLIRSNEATTAFHAWDPSPASIRYNGVSFSYLRKDVGMTTLVFNRPYGFVFRELQAPTAHPVTLRCTYPYDAGTSAAPNDACTFKQKCEDLGVTTVDAWLSRYANSIHGSCAFPSTAAGFQLSIDVRKALPAHANLWNEIMIGAWPEGIPEQLPLEAFFYPRGSTGLAGAQFIQRDYYTVTGRFLPIIQMDLAAAAGQPVFTYDPTSQGVSTTQVHSQRFYGPPLAPNRGAASER
ncbi:hypothetical protein [Pseudomonas eucalypticola]|uniref:Uncharacterized protein n=1 Tax=Pseudomonas eucalypticola TaxID=2599595 RepID=A0A7D5D8V7_9PSED|nr:hypothetical protein [Pseudomonas eucalypticola]QKZ04581.1 hypothetical protein HWQ56_12625 [Pseudomonas eucalypticola]